MIPIWLRACEADGSELNIHVQPGACRSELAGEHGDALRVRIRARAVDGAANEALIEFLTECLGLTRREVRLIRGDKSRRKTLWIALPPEAIARIISMHVD